MNGELYDSICKAKIKDSIFLASRLILKDQDKNFDIFINTSLAAISHIASYISVSEIKLWLNTLKSLQDIIDDPNIVMKDIYVLLTKLCLLSDIYIKNPVTKTGTIAVKLLREKIIYMFDDINFKLSDSGMTRFEGVLPPIDSHSHILAQQIITGYVYILKQLDVLDADKLIDVANDIRKSFDYIIRKKYTFETKFYHSDNDAVWFLWGIISLLYDDAEMNMIYQMFNYEYSKKTRTSRIGLLWGAAVAMVYIQKRDVARNWSKKELQLIMKIEEISMELYKDVKRDLIKSGELPQEVQQKSCIDGMEYIFNTRYELPTTPEIKPNIEPIDPQQLLKHIRYKKRFS